MLTTQSAVSRAPRPSSLADVLDLILDKGLVIDAYVRVSLLGIEVLTVDARIVVASVDTYLHFAEAVNRLDLGQTETQGIQGLTEGLERSGAQGKVQGAIEGGAEGLREHLPGRRDKSRSGGR
ncbi:MAG TPA: gas vesicle protein GvpJ [Acidimicrobiales bacterium]|nr:gas vesicle protein GvpJ [Acidimicrobiales bacterium]